jgi:hypothetical protein
VTSDLTLGGGARLSPEGQREGLFAFGARADVLFGGRGPHVPRVGPYLSVRTDDFSDLSLSLGASVLLPVTSTFPVVLSAGAVGRALAGEPAFGVSGRLWWGTRSYNFHSVYGMTAGLWVEARVFLTEPSTDVVAGVDLDLEAFALPWIFLWNALR